MSFENAHIEREKAATTKRGSGIVAGGEAVLLLVLLLVAAIMLRPSIHGNDGVQNYSYLRSMLIDRNIDFTNEYQHYIARSAHWFDHKEIDLNRDPNTSLPVNLYGVGSSVLWAPFVGLLHVVKIATDPDSADGYSRAYEIAVSLASCLYASVGVWLVFLILCKFWRAEAAMVASVAIWLATPLFFYTYLHPSMSHANSFFLAALIFYLYTGGDGKARWAVMGAASGLLIITRFQDASLLSFLAVGELLRRGMPEIHTGSGSRIVRYLLFVAGGVPFIFLQMCSWKVLHGSFFSGPRGYLDQGSINPLQPSHFIKVLFSSRHGLFFWHPVLLIALTGLLIPARFPRLKIICLVAFAAQLWVVSSWSVWWAGASFGHRMFISALPFLAVGAADIIATARHRFIVLATVVFLVFWNFGYAVQYGTGMISRQEAVSFATLARNNIVEIPRIAFTRIFGRQ